PPKKCHRVEVVVVSVAQGIKGTGWTGIDHGSNGPAGARKDGRQIRGPGEALRDYGAATIDVDEAGVQAAVEDGGEWASSAREYFRTIASFGCNSNRSLVIDGNGTGGTEGLCDGCEGVRGEEAAVFQLFDPRPVVRMPA